VIVGGILVSHVFTLVLMPAMLRLGERQAEALQTPMAPLTPIREAA
jgi:Cu/Ag efflux pump CusA